MIDLSRLFDPYARQARLFPGLLTIFPIILTAVAWFPELVTGSWGATLLTISTSCGLLYALSVLSRSRGKVVERRLLKIWGGWPTTIWLRHRNPDLLGPVRLRYHEFLKNHVPNLVVPTRDEEEKDPANADASYASAVKWLQERCRGKTYPLVEKENAEYGFRRNLRGMKPIGIACCVVAVAVSILAIGLAHDGIASAIASLSPVSILHALVAVRPAAIGATIVDIIAIFGWLFVVTDNWVRDAADQYARALLANCDSMPTAKLKTPKAGGAKAPGTKSRRR